jgi:hypothetical protein
VVVIAAVGAAGLAFGPWRTKAAAAPTHEVTSAAGPVIPPPPGDSAPSSKTVQVAITAPPDAKVEVDGRLVEVKEGKVDVLGALGSTHAVRVSAGGRETRADIAIAESGPIPARVELVVPRVATGGTHSAAPPVTATGAATAAATAATAVATQTVTKPPGTATGAPTINRNF